MKKEWMESSWGFDTDWVFNILQDFLLSWKFCTQLFTFQTFGLCCCIHVLLYTYHTLFTYQTFTLQFGRKFAKCPRIYLPNLSAPSSKVLDFNEKRLHLASIVPVCSHKPFFICHNRLNLSASSSSKVLMFVSSFYIIPCYKE